MSYSVYILYSDRCRKFYTGQSDDCASRLIRHNKGETKSIRICIPWRLIWSLTCVTRAEAMMFEKKIKSRGAGRFLADLGIEVA